VSAHSCRQTHRRRSRPGAEPSSPVQCKAYSRGTRPSVSVYMWWYSQEPTPQKPTIQHHTAARRPEWSARYHSRVSGVKCWGTAALQKREISVET
jgi:hypothetical protein